MYSLMIKKLFTMVSLQAPLTIYNGLIFVFEIYFPTDKKENQTPLVTLTLQTKIPLNKGILQSR